MKSPSLNVTIFAAILVLWSSASALAQLNQTDAQGRKQGEWVKTHPETGKIAYRTHFKNDVPMGTTERFYEDGTLQARIRHRRGGVDEARIYHPEGGGLMAQGIYRDQQRDSLWLFFSADSVLRAEESYRKGEKHGYSRTYFEDGSISEKANYVNGMKEGEWEQYYANGNLRLKATVEDGISYVGEFLSFYENGRPMQKGRYQDGKRTGSWYEYLESGAIEVIYVYREGKVESEHPQNGVFEDYYVDDILRNSYTYKNGKRHGPFKEYYHQGEWRVEQSVDEFGNARPVQRLYGTQVMREGKYHEGELHGEVITYSEKGKIKQKETYDKGNKLK